MWRFDIEYRPGKLNSFADAVSRKPNSYAEIASASLMHHDDILEESLVASIFDDMDKFFAVTLDRVKSESKSDNEIRLLTHAIKEGFPKSKSDIPNEIASYWEFRDGLTSLEWVVMNMDRIVPPTKLRSRILENLHSAHQGTSGIFSRAKAVVFWPGITSDIEESRAKCRTCHKNTPSQAKLPPMEPRILKFPF